MCSFTIAVNPKYKREGEEDKTQFFKVTAWRKLGEVCGKYVKKGQKVAVVGPVELQTYTDNKGNTRSELAVTADDVEFLSSKSESNSNVGYVNESAPVEQATTPDGFTDVSNSFDTTDLPF